MHASQAKRFKNDAISNRIIVYLFLSVLGGHRVEKKHLYPIIERARKATTKVDIGMKAEVFFFVQVPLLPADTTGAGTERSSLFATADLIGPGPSRQWHWVLSRKGYGV
ncbi:hypothetical protein HRR83_004970 [Exophiala dermatitidis]|nr:hypothetical protein HRR83_004970 [Exophiala dermatitidis]